jgi:hypothetical protein
VKESFIEKNFRGPTLALIDKANEIIAEYDDQGLVLTNRQLFYQFVARDWLPNSAKSYGLICKISREGRMAGLIDWDMIEDRTREATFWRSYAGPAAALRRCAQFYKEDPWALQCHRPEVWVEKDALVGVIAGICGEYHVPYLSCRGNASHSLLYEAGKRFEAYIDRGLIPVVLYLGDHDPNGIDMTRDIRERLLLFINAASKDPFAISVEDEEHAIEVRRLALNRDQVNGLPPNYAKETDSRYKAYVREVGTTECWELDALAPDVIVGLIRTALDKLIDRKKWDQAKRQLQRNRRKLTKVADDWK